MKKVVLYGIVFLAIVGSSLGIWVIENMINDDADIIISNSKPDGALVIELPMEDVEAHRGDYVEQRVRVRNTLSSDFNARVVHSLTTTDVEDECTIGDISEEASNLLMWCNADCTSGCDIISSGHPVVLSGSSQRCLLVTTTIDELACPQTLNNAVELSEV